MKDYCPHCHSIQELTVIEEPTTVTVRGEAIVVQDRFVRCVSCGGETNDIWHPWDTLDAAYTEYRRRHSMTYAEWEKGVAPLPERMARSRGRK